MVAKIPARSPTVSPGKSTTVKTLNKPNNDDEELFESNTETKCSDTYHTSSVKKPVNADDGKISTGEFCSEYFGGMWKQVKKQGTELINTFKKHPVSATVAVTGTVAAAAYFPIVAGILGVISVGMGVCGLAKSITNGANAYKNYKNAKTDSTAKEQVREMGANTLNAVEDIALTFLGGKALLKPCKDWYIMKLEKLFTKKRFTRADFLKKEPALYMNETLSLKQIKNAVIEHFDDSCQSAVIFNSITRDKKTG